jgi:hypothetical protein
MGNAALAETEPVSGASRRAVVGGSVTGSVGELLRAEAEPGLAWRWVALGGGGLFLVGLVAAALFWPLHTTAKVTPTTSEMATAAAPTAVAAVAPPGAPAPTTAKAPEPAAEAPVAQTLLAIEGTESAEVLVDGNLVGMVPLEVPLPRKADPRHLLVRLEGYRPFVRTIAGDTNLHLTVTLKPIAAHHAGGHAAPVVRNPFDH